MTMPTVGPLWFSVKKALLRIELHNRQMNRCAAINDEPNSGGRTDQFVSF